jgi:hypothetical protein
LLSAIRACLPSGGMLLFGSGIFSDGVSGTSLMTRWRSCWAKMRPRVSCATSAATSLVMLTLVAPSVAANHDAILTADGQNFHIETLGASGPTIVFEAGLGNDSFVMKPVGQADKTGFSSACGSASSSWSAHPKCLVILLIVPMSG